MVTTLLFARLIIQEALLLFPICISMRTRFLLEPHEFRRRCSSSGEASSWSSARSRRGSSASRNGVRSTSSTSSKEMSNYLDMATS